MAKKEAELKPNLKKVVALITGKQLSGMVYWTEHEGSTYVGTRHWIIRTQVMIPEIRAALAKIGLYEAGKAITYGPSVIQAPDITGFLRSVTNPTPIDLSDTRFTFDPLEEGDPAIRLLHEQSGRKHHALNNNYFKAMDAMFPYSPLTVRGKCIVFGNLQAMILPFNFTTSAAYTAVQKYMKQDIHSATSIDLIEA